MKLSQSVKTNRRFSRSANVERDRGAAAIDGYIPTGRAVDVVGRLARGLSDATAGRAFSITGPHGGGKSSLAVFLDAALSPRKSVDHGKAIELLSSTDPAVARALVSGLKTIDPAGRGAVRAFVTAEREPVTFTVARALHAGAVAELGPSQRHIPASFETPDSGSVNPREIVRALTSLCTERPVVLIIDEFGKNLEAYAEVGGDGDPFLLQELAESAQGESPLPFAIITMQHLSFDEYVQEATATRRREWAKVQGRFQDIPYVETAAQSRRLIAASIARGGGQLNQAVLAWADAATETLQQVGLRELEDTIAAAYPLHPLSLAVLPELCSRYGQNERTLFSFLAGAEPMSVPAFLSGSTWTRDQALPFVGLDRVYDYFLDSASTTIGTSATASRWLEIEARIRDTAGLSPAQSRTLKWIGVLNLVSSAGTLRASRRLLHFGLGHAGTDSLTSKQVDSALESLEGMGLVTYREFADEFRIWNGSDYDLRGAVELARREVSQRPLASLLNEAAPLEPAVAGRHSQNIGILRVFNRRFSDLSTVDLVPPETSSPWDGSVLYSVNSEGDALGKTLGLNQKPVMVVSAPIAADLRDIAIEATALRIALASAETNEADWVARRELIERASSAQQRLRDAVASTWNNLDSQWTLLNDGTHIDGRGGVSSALSEASDRVYVHSPRLANEMIAKRELTSQGAKARRVLLEALLERPAVEAFGIEGYGPDRAMYEAVFRTTGLHRSRTDGWSVGAPKDSVWRKVWTALNEALSASIDARVNLVAVAERLKEPPFGLKDGVIPVLLIAALTARADEIALYEHGSLVLVLDDAVAERLAKNVGHFTVKNPAATTGSRREVVDAVVAELDIRSLGGNVLFLQATRAIYRVLRTLEPYAQNTKDGVSPSAAAVRNSFKLAAEPDELFFTTLPKVLGFKPFSAQGKADPDRATKYAQALSEAIGDLRGAYGRLLENVGAQLAKATGAYGDALDLRTQLGGQAANLQGLVLEPRLRALVGALGRTQLEPDDWLTNVAMVVAEGQSPRAWTDDLAARFEFQMAEMGGALRRMSALLFEKRAEGGTAFESRRVTITRPDGTESADVVSLTDAERVAVETSLQASLEVLAEQFGSTQAARRTLLAWLALTEETASPDVDQADSQRRVGER